MAKRRLSGWLLLSVFLFVLIFSWGYIFAESGHDCVGEGCPVCAGLLLCAGQMGRLFDDAIVAAAAAVSLLFMARALPRISPLPLGSTPVSLKVEMLC